MQFLANNMPSGIGASWEILDLRMIMDGSIYEGWDSDATTDTNTILYTVLTFFVPWPLHTPLLYWLNSSGKNKIYQIDFFYGTDSTVEELKRERKLQCQHRVSGCTSQNTPLSLIKHSDMRLWIYHTVSFISSHNFYQPQTKFGAR